MGDEFKMTTGQAHELAMAFGRNGWSNADVKKLSEGENLTQILSVLRGDIELTPVMSYSRRLAPEHIPEGWLVMPGEVVPSEFDVSNLKTCDFFKDGERSIGGQEVCKRALELRCNFGLVDGKRMLNESSMIPTILRSYRIPLPGTILYSPDGRLCMSCLQFDRDDEYWEMGSYPLYGEFERYLYCFAQIE